MEHISASEKNILRELAKKRLEYANSPQNLENIRLWYKHNDCRGERPMVHVELNTFRHEVVPQRMKCQSENARWLESDLLSGMLNFELFGDDRPVLAYFPIPVQAWFTPFGLETKREVADEGLGFHIEPVINDLEQDFHLLGESPIFQGPYFNAALTDMADETFGDILPTKRILNSVYSCPTYEILARMGMETMFMSMYDYPELFHKMMSQYADDTLRLFDHMENEGLILPTVDGENLTMGSFCYTNDLPKTATTVGDVWGHMNCQEGTGLSAEMFAEFIFPYYKKIADRFGLLSYGCCEAVDPQWDSLSKFTNLRKVSVSPWCNEEFMGEQLQGKKIIYQRKPAPNFIGIGTGLDEDAVRADIRRTVKAARSCPLEIGQRDVYSINHDVEKVHRYVQIIKEECGRHDC